MLTSADKRGDQEEEGTGTDEAAEEAEGRELGGGKMKASLHGEDYRSVALGLA